jgi:transmembrane sensor
MSEQEEQVREVIARQAAEWFVRQRGAELGAADQREFANWLAVSPIHVEEYLGIARLTQDLPAAAAVLEASSSLDQLLERARNDDSVVVALESPRATRAVHAYRKSRVAWQAFAALAVMVALMGIGLLWWNGYGSTTERYATRHGELGSWQLADHTLLRLNTDSAVTVRYSRRARVVQIERGQAYFEVAPDAARRFQVDAGPALVTDIGTKFDVYRKESSTIVTVVEGLVRVDAARESVRARAGEQVQAYADRSPVVVPVEPGRATAWLQKRMVFHGEPLRAVVAEFNRYSAVPIEIESPALAELNVSGAFSTDDTPSFISFLKSVNNATVTADSSRVLVRERRVGSISGGRK